MIVYAANNGLPQGVSLAHVISSIPNFAAILASCWFSEGSLNRVVEFVYSRNSSERIREEITDLVQMVTVTCEY